jgi:hypothetical protein
VRFVAPLECPAIERKRPVERSEVRNRIGAGWSVLRAFEAWTLKAAFWGLQMRFLRRIIQT